MIEFLSTVICCILAATLVLGLAFVINALIALLLQWILLAAGGITWSFWLCFAVVTFFFIMTSGFRTASK